MKSADVQREGGQCTAALDLIHPQRQGVEATSFNLLCGPKTVMVFSNTLIHERQVRSEKRRAQDRTGHSLHALSASGNTSAILYASATDARFFSRQPVFGTVSEIGIRVSDRTSST